MDRPKTCQACPQGQEASGADRRPLRPGGRHGPARCLPDRRSFVPRAAPGGGHAPKGAGQPRPFRAGGARRRRGPRRVRSRLREGPRCGTPASRARARRPAPGIFKAQRPTRPDAGQVFGGDPATLCRREGQSQSDPGEVKGASSDCSAEVDGEEIRKTPPSVVDAPRGISIDLGTAALLAFPRHPRSLRRIA
jgi:hypothetical protein